MERKSSYMAPAIEVTDIQVGQLIASSPAAKLVQGNVFNSTIVGGSVPSRSRGRDRDSWDNGWD